DDVVLVWEIDRSRRKGDLQASPTRSMPHVRENGALDLLVAFEVLQPVAHLVYHRVLSKHPGDTFRGRMRQYPGDAASGLPQDALDTLRGVPVVEPDTDRPQAWERRSGKVHDRVADESAVWQADEVPLLGRQ